MAFSEIQGAPFSSSIGGLPPASGSLADSQRGFCTIMIKCVLKVITAVRHFFTWIFCCDSPQNPRPPLTYPTSLETPFVSPPAAEALVNNFESTEEHGEMRTAFDSEPDRAIAPIRLDDFSTPEIEASVDIQNEQTSSFCDKGRKILSKNGNQVLSKITGIKTEYANSAMGHLAQCANAATGGKYKIAAVAGLSSVSAVLLASTSLFMPKEMRELNRVTTHVIPIS